MSVVMGTAGHIDHGKTSLVKALTQINCDRLAEEQKRGITIELGFAFLDLPAGRRLSIIDVPGHERFVHTMMAGATGIDFVLLVIAADEGIMPQTREHLEICSLLGIKNGLVALTKVDMVDEELLELAKEDVTSYLKGSFLEGAPVLPVSAHTGQGLPELLNLLESIEKNLAPKRRSDLLRLPIDRVFTIKGHGTVVTGTMISGKVKVGDEICIYPKLHRAKIRSLHSHNASSELGLAGKRTALNLLGLATGDIQKGDVISQPHALFPSCNWLCEIKCLASSPKALRQRTEVHLHHGSKSSLAKIYLPNTDKLEAGQTAIAQIQFAEPMLGVFGDHFVIRSFSPLQTVAGGRILHPLEHTLKKKSKNFDLVLDALKEMGNCLAHNNLPSEKNNIEIDEKLVLAALAIGKEHGLSFAELGVCTNFESKYLEKVLANLGGKQLVICTDKENRIYHSQSDIEEYCQSLLRYLENFHAAQPMRSGLGKGEISSGWGKGYAPKLLHSILERLQKQGKIAYSKDSFHLAQHKATLGLENEEIRNAILLAHKKAALTPPNMKDVLEALNLEEKEVLPLLKHLQNSGELVKVCDGIWYAKEAIQEVYLKIMDWYKTNENLDLADLKKLTNLSRKYLVALLEYFDKEKITVRVGDKRILRK